MHGRSAQKRHEITRVFFDLSSRPSSSRQNRHKCRVDETPEEYPSANTEVSDQKVLGETPEAVKPCLEDDEQDQETMLEC